MDEIFTKSGMIKVKNENGQLTVMGHDEITCLLYNALKSSGNTDRLIALNLADKVLYRISSWMDANSPTSMAEVEYMVKFVLQESGHTEASKYIGGNTQIPQLNWG
jgi:hypothetical protein